MATIIITIVWSVLAICIGIPVILVIAGIVDRGWRQPRIENKLQRLFSSYDHLEVVEDRLRIQLYSQEQLSGIHRVHDELRAIANKRAIAWKEYTSYSRQHPRLYKSPEQRRLMRS